MKKIDDKKVLMAAISGIVLGATACASAPATSGPPSATPPPATTAATTPAGANHGSGPSDSVGTETLPGAAVGATPPQANSTPSANGMGGCKVSAGGCK
jgi:hypothetical protein